MAATTESCCRSRSSTPTATRFSRSCAPSARRTWICAGALRGIDLLFADFDLALEEKREIARGACRGYGREFGAGKPFQRAISRRYRDERESVERLLDTGHAPPSELAPVADALARRSERIRPVAAELRKVAAGGRLTQTV